MNVLQLLTFGGGPASVTAQCPAGCRPHPCRSRSRSTRSSRRYCTTEPDTSTRTTSLLLTQLGSAVVHALVTSMAGEELNVRAVWRQPARSRWSSPCARGGSHHVVLTIGASC